MSLINNLCIKFFAKKIGQDKFGNSYYLGKGQDYLGNFKRYVIYNGINQSSKIPPMWHSWLHYANDEVPTERSSFNWEKPYLPNVTGTKYAYDPAKAKNKRIKTYESWTPK
jgi:NADH:ubiquinone oxidoreductase subunit